jgi:hypothetical protein
MPGTKTLIFPIETLLTLLTHYTEGYIPLDARPLELLRSPILDRYIAINVESNQWQDQPNAAGIYEPAQIRFMGGKVAKWGSKADTPPWTRHTDEKL